MINRKSYAELNYIMGLAERSIAFIVHAFWKTTNGTKTWNGTFETRKSQPSFSKAFMTISKLSEGKGFTELQRIRGTDERFYKQNSIVRLGDQLSCATKQLYATRFEIKTALCVMPRAGRVWDITGGLSESAYHHFQG